MEKLMSNRLIIYSIVSFALFALCTILYVEFGDESNFWWIFDKLNDRILTINLLLITSFIFREVTYRLFSYAAIGYVLLYGVYECSYILYNNVTVDYFVGISALYLSIVTIILLIVAYVSKGNRK